MLPCRAIRSCGAITLADTRREHAALGDRHHRPAAAEAHGNLSGVQRQTADGHGDYELAGRLTDLRRMDGLAASSPRAQAGG